MIIHVNDIEPKMCSCEAGYIVRKIGQLWGIGCPGEMCQASTHLYETRNDAVFAWNDMQMMQKRITE